MQLASQWVEGDPRRDGRVGITYAVDPQLQILINGLLFPLIENGAGFRQATQGELDGYMEEAMQAWRERSCSDAPITRVAVGAGTDPDFLDDLFLGRPAPSANYVQPADLVQAGWQPPAFFDALAPDGSDFILGVTFTFIFTDEDDNPTDVDGNGRADVALKEIYYNPSFAWTNRGAPGAIDFFSVIAHETGHGLGLAHFGKVFVTKKDAADGLQIAGREVRAPGADERRVRDGSRRDPVAPTTARSVRSGRATSSGDDTTWPGAGASLYSPPRGQVAQLVEQRTENPRVGGSIPSLAIRRPASARSRSVPWSHRSSS